MLRFICVFLAKMQILTYAGFCRLRYVHNISTARTAWCCKNFVSTKKMFRAKQQPPVKIIRLKTSFYAKI